MSSVTTPNQKSSGARILALAKAEWRQFARNKLIVFMSAVFPVGMPLVVWFAFKPETEAQKQAIGSMAVESYLMITLFLVIFYSVLSMSTTRRDEGVLKRLRTGEARDMEILTAISVPGIAVTIGFFVVLVGILVWAGSIPAMLPLTILALLLGVVVFAACAYLTCAHTKNAEAAQLTSMPVMALAVFSMSTNRSILPETLQHYLNMFPFAAIFDLANLGWSGASYKTMGPEATALPTAEILSSAITPTLVVVFWIAILLWSVAMYMRWDTHRG